LVKGHYQFLQTWQLVNNLMEVKMKLFIGINRMLFYLLALPLVGIVSACTVSQIDAEPALSANSGYPSPLLPTSTSQDRQAYPGPSTPDAPIPTISPTRPRPLATNIPPMPTLTPSLPTATPQPIPTIDPKLNTLIYATSGEKGPEIYRVQFSNTGKESQPAMRIDTPYLWQNRTYLKGLYPSPNNQSVVVAWQYGEGGNFVSILKISDGTSRLLLEQENQLDRRVKFLGWSPTSDSILVLGDKNNLDLQQQLLLVDVHTGDFRPIPIQPLSQAENITSASFSPDGKSIVYARSTCYQCGSEIRQISMESQEERTLFSDEEYRIQSVLWSPSGDYIAFTRWDEAETSDFKLGELKTPIAIGELWLLDVATLSTHQVDRVLTGYEDIFGLAWSPTGSELAFIQPNQQTKIIGNPTGNLHTVQIATERVSTATTLENRILMKPSWFNSTTMTALANQSDSTTIFALWLPEGQSIGNAANEIVIDARIINPSIVWIPAEEEGK